MKALLYLLIFLVLLGLSLHFLLMNSHQTVSLELWGGVRTPDLPVGLLVLLSFFSGFVIGILILPLTYVIKRLSSRSIL